MRSKSISLTTAVAFGLTVAAPAATEVFLGSSSGSAGETISVPLQFASDEEIVGVQFDVSIETETGAVAVVTAGLDFNFTDHGIETELLSTGALRVLISSRSSAGLYSGNLARIAVDLTADVSGMARSVALSNVVFATRDGTKAALEVVPHLAVTNPARGAHFAPGAEIQIEAESVGTLVAGAIVQIEFFANGESIGADDTAPYTAAWTPAEAGNYAVTAVATSSAGGVRNSAALPVLVGVSSGFEGWRLDNFDPIELADITISGASANPDGDRLNNAGEFGFGGLPLSFDHSPIATEILTDHATGDRHLSFSFWRSIFVSETDIQIEQTGDLSAWLPAPGSVVNLLVVPYGSFERITIFDTAPIGPGEPRKMLRASIQLP